MRIFAARRGETASPLTAPAVNGVNMDFNGFQPYFYLERG